MKNYLFDVDGTLTPHRRPMLREHWGLFTCWMKGEQKKGNTVNIITGSDKDKTVKQVGHEIWNDCDNVWQNCGNELWQKGQLVYSSDWKVSGDFKLLATSLMMASPWWGTAIGNIEQRKGMVNISTIGRAATHWQRRGYHEWEEAEKLAGRASERVVIAEELMLQFPHLDYSIGGHISIDIYPQGKDKGQVYDYFNEGELIFFGDSISNKGNDYCLAKHMTSRNDMVYAVDSPARTMELLNVTN